MFKIRYPGLIILILAIMVGCQKGIPEWPKYVFESLWIPREAEKIEYHFIGGSYQIQYEVSICYPANDFISRLVNQMKNRKWTRLDFDFLNPGLNLNPARGLGGEWSRLVDRDRKRDVYQWIEDWEDSQKTIVRYVLKYRIPMGGGITKDKCSLRVNAIYIPVEIRPAATGVSP